MTELLPSKTLTVSIACPPERVYAFASNPQNFPLWVTSFVIAARQTAEGWILDTTEGPVGIVFAAPNPFGVLDHLVTFPSGVQVMNPMRVVPNGAGSDVSFTLFQRPTLTEELFAHDARMVERDLQTLKRTLE